MSISDHELLKALAEDVPDMALSVREHLRIIASRLEAAEQQQQEPVGEGLKPVDPALLQPFKAAMQNETIPAIVDAVRQRQRNAAEDRGGLYTHQQPQAQGDIARVYEAFGIGEDARTISTLMTNIRNAMRRADCLSAIEREFFMVVGEPIGDEEPEDECLLNWGDSPEEYINRFRDALTKIQPRAAVPDVIAGNPAIKQNQALIEAAPPQPARAAVPDGFKLVPIEPTSHQLETMKFRHWEQFSCQLDFDHYSLLYKTAIAAAPAQPGEGE